MTGIAHNAAAADPSPLTKWAAEEDATTMYSVRRNLPLVSDGPQSVRVINKLKNTPCCVHGMASRHLVLNPRIM